MRRRRRVWCRSCATRARCSSGADASAVIGDYVAGVNHVLPTGGTARFADALRVDDFRKHMHVVSLEPGALRRARAVRDDAGRGRRAHRARRRDPPAGVVVSAATEGRVQPRDDLRALDGYHSPQVDVPVRLNTNESPYAPPAEFVTRYTAALARRRLAPLSRSRRARPPRRARCVPRPTERAAALRERQQRGAADAAAHLRRHRPARAAVRADVRAARADRAHDGDRGRDRRARRRLRDRRRRRRRARAVGAPVGRVRVQPEQPDRHGRAARDRRAAARRSRPRSARCSWSTRPTASSRRGARSSWSTTTGRSWSCAPTRRCGRWRRCVSASRSRRRG